jgi:hypothetical protein
MKLERIGLAVIIVILATLACDRPTPEPVQPPPTVTPYVPQQVDPTAEQDTTTEEPAATPEPPTPTPEPVATAEPQPTATPEPVSTGPLDFPEPRYIHSWEPLPNGQVRVTLLVQISGGAPPFTVRHDIEAFQTSERDYLLVFDRAGCAGMAHTITVESADGQSVSHDYWIGAELQPWCN